MLLKIGTSTKALIDNEAENPAKLSEREVTVTETSADQESSPEETTEAETTAEETKAN